MRRGPSSTDMEKLAHNGPDHRNGYGVASKPSDGRYRTVNLYPYGEVHGKAGLALVCVVRL